MLDEKIQINMKLEYQNTFLVVQGDLFDNPYPMWFQYSANIPNVSHFNILN